MQYLLRSKIIRHLQQMLVIAVKCPSAGLCGCEKGVEIAKNKKNILGVSVVFVVSQAALGKCDFFLLVTTGR